jgi:DNA-directed RNA polymerase subunit RPC12/RpoP
MIKRKFICKNCGERFVAKVLEPGEAEEKGIRSAPVRCPNCGSTEIERD